MFDLLIVALAAAAVLIAAAIFGKRHARRFQRERRIRIDRFKLKRRHAEIELEVFGSREIVQAIQAYARDHHVSIEQARRQAQTYLQEIVPKFNLLAYYRIGAPIARAIMHFLYRVVVERRPLRDFNDRMARGATVVYVINHRSNADYVLVAHMLFKFISLSYAIGEWARVWPLNHVFKWFGGYFVRRRYREPLYHAVLAKFVQTITKHGVTQGIFIEGGLTRDGAFQKPKLGMLDYLVTAKRDPEFTSPLFIVPTAVNYDRVLEDRNLTEEVLGRDERRTKGEKLRATFDYLFRNFWRGVFRRFKRYGYAIVMFGEPISIDEFVAAHPEVLSHSFDDRKAALQLLGDEVMSQISRALPVTPVTLVARAFAQKPMLSTREILDELARVRAEWSDRVWLLREKTAPEIWTAARNILELRHLIQPVERWQNDLFGEGGAPELEDTWQWNPEQKLLRDYYANSLLTYDEVKRRGWPERKRDKAVQAAARAAEAYGS
ncbi:MAG TPA: 1-acyl-sn-glycerol-3-phosphate acyltransferase [Thermoanaerobaculia bacterium]|nr:1-acyl-sn-glycerol-3-phosphate acyltransferase [Thermoanaerobaculia bacterium]